MKVILRNVPPENFTLAGRAVQFLLDRPGQTTACVAYGDQYEVVFDVVRNKTSITVWGQCPLTDG